MGTSAASGLTHFTIEPLQKTFGAVVTDLRLAELDNDAFSDLYAAWLEYALLIFPGQNLCVKLSSGQILV